MKTYKVSINIKKSSHALLDNLIALAWALGRHAFLVILITILLCIVFGQLLFYYYFAVLTHQKKDSIESNLNFREDLYASYLKNNEKKVNNINESLNKEYINPF